MKDEIRYNVAVRVLHWLVFLAALIAVVAIELDDSHDGGRACCSGFISRRVLPCSR